MSAKADQALASSGMAGPASAGKQADKFFRDLGVLAYLEATGRPADPAEKDRVMGALQGFEGQGAIGSFALQTAAPPPPGAVAGGYAAAPPPPGGYGAPTGGAAAPGGGYAAPPPPPPPGWGSTPPPPPPPPPA